MTFDDDVVRLVREIPDWPEPGVTFRDITPLLADPKGFANLVNVLEARAREFGPVDVVVGIEARGFILAAPLAERLGAGFVPVRKSGKLPAETVATSFDLEYGSAVIELHVDAIRPGQRVLVVDDVLATGGTIAATELLIGKVGGAVAGHLVLIELAALGGRERLGNSPCVSLLTY